MKKLLAMLVLTLTFAAVSGTQAPNDMPMPVCFPCSS